MMAEWRKVKLGKLSAKDSGAIAIGPFGSRMKADCYVPFGVPVIRGTNISDGRSWKGDWVYISEQIADSMPNCNVRSGDLVFPHRGSIGEVAIIPDDGLRYMISTSLMKFTCDPEKANPLYLFYYFRSSRGRAEIMKYSSQVGTPGIGQPLASLKQFEVYLPPLAEQNNIAFLLSTIDDKIVLNHKMNQTLEAIAEALFKSWFVDFDPVKAKEEGCKPEGMDDATADLFPSNFTESPLGSIPEGWEISSLGDFIELAYGRALKANGRNEGSVPVYGSNGQIGWHDTALVKGPGVVVGRKGNPGTVIYVHQDFFPIDTTFFIIPSQRVPSIIFLYMLMERLGLPGLSADSAVPGLNRNAAYSAKCILPPPPLIENFNKYITPFMLKMEFLKDENKRLIDVRDLLLPHLISGKLRIADDTL